MFLSLFCGAWLMHLLVQLECDSSLRHPLVGCKYGRKRLSSLFFCCYYGSPSSRVELRAGGSAREREGGVAVMWKGVKADRQSPSVWAQEEWCCSQTGPWAEAFICLIRGLERQRVKRRWILISQRHKTKLWNIQPVNKRERNPSSNTPWLT